MVEDNDAARFESIIEKEAPHEHISAFDGAFAWAHFSKSSTESVARIFPLRISTWKVPFLVRLSLTVVRSRLQTSHGVLTTIITIQVSQVLPKHYRKVAKELLSEMNENLINDTLS